MSVGGGLVALHFFGHLKRAKRSKQVFQKVLRKAVFYLSISMEIIKR
jgi:hypothetical protein